MIGPEAVACATTGVDGVDRGLPIQPGDGLEQTLAIIERLPIQPGDGLKQTLAIIEREAELAKIGVGQ